MSTQVIPFGKYQGQPVEVLETDPNYKNWLLNQPWFAEKYPTIQTLIINNVTEPEDTPEHNAMQLKLLDSEYLIKLAKVCGECGVGDTISVSHHYKVNHYDSEWVRLESHVVLKRDDIEVKGEFECHGFDYVFYYYWRKELEIEGKKYTGGDTRNFCVELKTSVGDDFPAVLRQCKRNNTVTSSRTSRVDYRGKVVVIAEQFNSQVATLDQVKQMFKASDMLFLLQSEVETQND